MVVILIDTHFENGPHETILARDAAINPGCKVPDESTFSTINFECHFIYIPYTKPFHEIPNTRLFRKKLQRLKATIS